MSSLKGISGQLWVQDNWELRKKWASTGKIHFEWSSNSEFEVGSSGLFLELRPEDHWRNDSTLFFFFRVSSCLERTKNPENDRLCWLSLMTKFAHKGPPHHLPVQVSTAQQGEYKHFCFINYVICQEDMYTVAKKVILSVCCKLFVAHVPHHNNLVPFPLII